MKIAVIDDEKNAQLLLQEYMKKFSCEKNCVLESNCFNSGQELLDNYKAVYDILIFDINMPGINGLETAKKVREKDKAVVILFITSMTEYAINGYEVEAIDYVIKPITYFDFALKMNKAIRKASHRVDNSITIEAATGIQNLLLSDIYYLEIFAHYLVYHTKLGDFNVRGCIKDTEKTLIPYNFFRCYRSYIVNLNYVRAVKANDIIVGNSTLQIGRAYKNAFMQEYLRFLQG